MNEELGTNDPLIEQFGRLVKGVVTFDYGDSYAQNRPVSEVIGDAFWRSMKLLVYALVLTIPLSIMAGIFAARRQGKIADRSVVTLGLASSSIPEFVSSVILQAVIGVKLGWFHVVANAPAGSSIMTQLSYLTLPAMALVIVYFGYIARMTRAGVIGALDADFTRTATMKGLSKYAGDAPARAAQRPPGDGVGDRRADRIRDGQPGGDREDLQLSGPRV